MATRTTTTRKAAARKATTTTKRTTAGHRSATNGTSPARPSTEATEVVCNATGLPRLGKGALEVLVLDHLKKHPRVEFTSTELSHKLHRSNGAIQNNLEKFAKQGIAVRTSHAPRRYRYAGAKATRGAGSSKKKER